MAGRAGKVAVSITADPAGLERGLRKADADLGRFGSRGAKHLDGLKTAAMGAGAALTGALVYGLKESVDAAMESQKVNAQLQAQLKTLGISYKAHAKEIDNVIQKTSRLSGLDDEDLTRAFTNVVRATGSVNVAMKDMAVVADLARVRHMDVAKAGDLVAKVHAGNVGALKRLGLAITPVTKAQDTLRNSVQRATVEQQRAAKQLDTTATAHEALALLQRKVAGQAAAYGKTAAGAQDRFRVAVENLKEAIGGKLLPLLTPLANRAAKFVDQMQQGTGAGGRFADQLKEIYNRVKPIVKFFTDHPKLIATAVGAWAIYRTRALRVVGGLIDSIRQMFMSRAISTAAAEGGAVAGRTMATTTASALTKWGGWATVGLMIAQALGLDTAIQKAVDDAKRSLVGAATDRSLSGLPGASLIPSGPMHDSGTSPTSAGRVHPHHRRPVSTGSAGGAGGQSIQDIINSAGGGTTSGTSSASSAASRTTRALMAPNTAAGRTARALYQAGFRGQTLLNFLAIASRESHFNPGAKNLTYPDHSIGLFQINQLAHHGRYGSDAQLMDPLTNARAARALYRAGGYSPWKGPGGSWRSGISASGWRTAINTYKRLRMTSTTTSAGASGPSTLIGIAKMIASKFGLRISSTYRDPQHNAAVGGVPNSWHTRGTPSNPGAVDMVGSMSAMQSALAWAKSNIVGLAEAMIHDVGSGLHLHLAGAPVHLKGAAAGSSSSSSSRLGGGASLSDIMSGDYSHVSGTLDNIGLMHDAGMISGGRAQSATLGVIKRALSGGFGPLSRHDRLELKAQRHGIVTARRQSAAQTRKSAAKRKQTQAKQVKGIPAWIANQDLAKVDQAESVGKFTSAQANLYRLAVIDRAMNGYYGPIKGSDRTALLQVWTSVTGAAWPSRGNIGPDGTEVAATDPTSFAGTEFDDAALALAGLTSDTTDDRNVLTGRLGIAKANLASAKASGNRDDIATWATTVKGLQDSIDSLNDATDANTRALLDLQKQQTENYQRLYNVSQSQYGTLTRALADIVSGELGGRIGLGFSTPSSAGSLASY